MSAQIIDLLSSDEELQEQPAKRAKTSLIRPHVTLTPISKCKEDTVMVLSDDEGVSDISIGKIKSSTGTREPIVLSDEDNDNTLATEFLPQASPSSTDKKQNRISPNGKLKTDMDAAKMVQTALENMNDHIVTVTDVDSSDSTITNETPETALYNGNQACVQNENVSDPRGNEISKNSEPLLNETIINSTSNHKYSENEKQELSEKDVDKSDDLNKLIDTNESGLDTKEKDQNVASEISNSNVQDTDTSKILETSIEVTDKKTDHNVLMDVQDSEPGTEPDKSKNNPDGNHKIVNNLKRSQEGNDADALVNADSTNKTIAIESSSKNLEVVDSISQEKADSPQDPQEENTIIMHSDTNKANKSDDQSQLGEECKDVRQESDQKSNDLLNKKSIETDDVVMLPNKSPTESIVIDDSETEMDKISKSPKKTPESKKQNISRINSNESIQPKSAVSDLDEPVTVVSEINCSDDSIVINDSEEDTEKENRRTLEVFTVNVKKTACVDITSPGFKVEPAFKDFLRMVEERLIDSPFEELLPKKVPVIQKYFEKCVDHTDKHYFRTLLKDAIESMNKAPTSKAPDQAVLAFHSIYSYLKSRLEETVLEVEEEDVILLKKMERGMKILQKRIKELEETEVDLSDEEDSAYIMMDRYRDRFSKIHKKYCEMLRKNPYTGRATHDKIAFVNSDYTPINQAISKQYKNSLKFPSYYELEALIHRVNREAHLGLSEQKIKRESISCFKHLGALLQKKRRQELYDIHIEYIDYSEDPAAKDPSLDNILRKHNTEASVRLSQVMLEYVEKQEALEVEMSQSASHDESAEDMDSPGCSNKGKDMPIDQLNEVKKPCKRRSCNFTEKSVIDESPGERKRSKKSFEKCHNHSRVNNGNLDILKMKKKRSSKDEEENIHLRPRRTRSQLLLDIKKRKVDSTDSTDTGDDKEKEVAKEIPEEGGMTNILEQGEKASVLEDQKSSHPEQEGTTDVLLDGGEKLNIPEQKGRTDILKDDGEKSNILSVLENEKKDGLEEGENANSLTEDKDPLNNKDKEKQDDKMAEEKTVEQEHQSDLFGTSTENSSGTKEGQNVTEKAAADSTVKGQESIEAT